MPSYDSEARWLIFGKCPRQHFHVGCPQQAWVLGHRWPLIILKVPQTDSTGTHTHILASSSMLILLYGRDSPPWLVVKTSAKNAGSSIGNLLFSLSIWETLHQQKTESRLRNQILLRLQEQPGWWRRRRWGNRGSGRQRLNNLPRSTFSCLAGLACCLACPAPLSRCI